MPNDSCTHDTGPVQLLQRWVKEAKEQSGYNFPTAFQLATGSLRDSHSDNGPRIRTLLLKDWAKEGFVFFTNYLSPKWQSIKQNPKVGGHFYWDSLGRQVNLQGEVHKLAHEASKEYWATRPRASQLAQWVSRQSATVESAECLEQAYAKAEQRFLGVSVPCPKHWGGGVFVIESAEFWEQDPRRFHKRLRFTKKADKSWSMHWLWP